MTSDDSGDRPLHLKRIRTCKYGAATKKEIRRMAAKGRDVGTIAVWMNIPCSVVSAVLKEAS